MGPRSEALAATGNGDAFPQAAPADLKQQAAERVRAHRERRSKAQRAEEPSGGQLPRRSQQQPHHAIAAAVAERYAHTPSYRAVLAEQAQRAMEQARRDAESALAEAEVAARNAQAVAQVQQQLLDELELWNAPQEFTAETAEGTTQEALASLPQGRQRGTPKPASAAPVMQLSTAGLTVRLYENICPQAQRQPRAAGREDAAPANPLRADDAQDLEESLALDEEIRFRQAPVFEPFDIAPPTPLPANLLEFPRQLVAARKARPRLAEGPLAEEPPPSPQLRIFEVEPEQISAAPATPSAAPEWANIHLDAQPMHAPQAAPASAPSLTASLRPQAAPLELRAMSGAIDLILVGFALALFTGVAAHFAHRLPTGIPGAIAALATFAALYPLYELLFFTFSDQTPGMRYARIGLCTLSDENPSRAAIRKRIPARLFAICPLGLGILWALLDEDGLGWHDRISRMYQRAY